MSNALDRLTYEKAWLERGAKYIAGMDEVGRGPLAGPVTVACVVMPLDEASIVLEADDSKKLTEKKREELYELIMARALAVNIASADERVIDEINILNATKRCMREAANGLTLVPDVVLVDAVKIDCAYPVEAIIKGDAKSYSIACASIVAKVTRDRLMRRMDAEYPAYGFASNKGYGSAAHVEALRRVGPCPLHRRSFLNRILAEDAVAADEDEPLE